MSSNVTPAVNASGRLPRLFLSTLGGGLYSAARSMYRLARGKELRSPFSLKYKLGAWRHGFRADSAAVYDFPRTDRRNYVSDYVRIYRCDKINPAPQFFNQKLLLRAFLLTKGFAQADTFAFLAKGNILLRPFDDDQHYVSAADFERALIEDGGRFIVKPQDGTRGQNIFLLETRDGALVRVRGLEVQPFHTAELRGVVMVERAIKQGAFWRELCPHSTNTIRALTMWTPGDAAPFLGCAVQRVGTADTTPTDNWSGGGICAPVDLASGRLGPGRMHPLKGKRPQDRFTHHPDTGALIEGAVLPHWGRVRDTVLRAAASLPVNRYVGWDVVVDQAGTPVIIEGNNNTDVNLLQVHGGLLSDPGVRRFYEKVGVL